jgi:hypothetical protein
LKLIISLWGAIFSSAWRRETSRLAFEWDVVTFEDDEPDLPTYIRYNEIKKKKMLNKSFFMRYLWSQEQYLKIFASYCVLVFMVSIFGI